ncbi:ComEA family DNA-binding protein [Herbaspirillum sp. alder98]|uniref:ComEA family DNA-binding protein n=1 Tax=Herbaspirillum sp. alder98 TaxID=2913096 RepID=UPI001CD90A01|nr:helix-hairpin-helix domain-containing protein [Herbaspirillum sp. alder98]MCA1326825.1 helix-hairpin-helix domain-containing protein [Herbaspirillum sp. alder98]
MLKKLLMVIVSLWIMVAPVRADVDVNKADQAALDGVRGIGPSMSKRILGERDKGGNFKDWRDLQQRVKGIKEKSAEKLSGNGLTVNGQALGGKAAKPGKSGRAGSRAAPQQETKVASGEAAPAAQERARK